MSEPESSPSVGTNLCQCGCGEPANRGNRFIRNHHNRKSPTPYLEEQRGLDTPCWVWQRSMNNYGYGHVWSDGRTRLAHRFYYEKEHGPLAEGMELHHLCGVRACVRPSHMDAVSRAANTRLRGPHKLRRVCAHCGGSGFLD